MSILTFPIPLLGFAAFSGSGKTTLLEKILPLLIRQNLAVGMVKHAHHDFDIDIPGKDSYRLRKAGAQQMLVASANRWALMVESSQTLSDPVLEDLVHHFDLDKLDLILVEGFKHEAFPRIEVHRHALRKPYLFTQDSDIIALVSDTNPMESCQLPCFALDDYEAITQFIHAFVKQYRPQFN